MGILLAFHQIFAKIMIKCLRSHTHKMLQEEAIKRILARRAYRRTFSNDFCRIEAQNLKILAQLLDIVIHFHPGQRHLLIVSL